LPDLTGHKLGGYQAGPATTAVEPGTGERLVDEVVAMLRNSRSGDIEELASRLAG
jgi:hypothetical protein